MFSSQSLFKLIVGLVIGFLMWQIYIMEPSRTTPKLGYLNQFLAQHQYQQEQQFNSSTRYDNNISIQHQSTQLNGPKHNMTTPTNSINNSNYLTNSYLTESNYNLSLTEDLAMDVISNLTDVQNIEVITNQTNENITTHTNSINNTNILANSTNNLSLVSYPYLNVNYEALPKDDIGKLIDLHNFEYIINQKPCPAISLSSSVLSSDINNISISSLNFTTKANINNSYSKQNTDRGPPILLIFVTSSPRNHDRRLLIRETWGSPANTTNNIRLIFLLAAVNEIELQESIENESRLYSDIVQGNFIDAYRNMTYKHVMALKWFTYYCPDAKYILKIDDDIFVNTPGLVDHLTNVAQRNNLLFCQEQGGVQVDRGGTKWSVSKEEYSGDYFPTYCPGYAIVYSSDVAFRLYLEAQKTRYFWIDDIHVTGILAQQANIKITSFIPYLLFRYTWQDILAGKIDIKDNPFLFVLPGLTEEESRKLWRLIENLR